MLTHLALNLARIFKSLLIQNVVDALRVSSPPSLIYSVVTFHITAKRCLYYGETGFAMQHFSVPDISVMH